MQSSKLIILLKSLKAEEIRWLTKFVCSPFYNSNSHVIALFEVLKKHHPDFTSNHLTKEKIWIKLFPNQKMAAGRLRLLMHNLAELIEEFIVANRLKKQTVTYQSLLNQEFGERDLYDFFEKMTFQLLAELDKEPYRDHQYFKQKKELLVQWYGHPGTNRQQQTDIVSLLLEDQKIHNALEELQLIFAHNARTIVSLETQQKMISPTILAIAKTSQNVLLNLYVFLAALQDGVKNLQEIINYFSENLQKIRSKDRRTILQILINHSTRLYNSGKVDKPRKTLDLYKLGLQNDCILVNDEITEATFQNIIVLGSTCKDWDWVEDFINKFQNKLPQTSREEATILGKALFHFYQQNFDAAIDILGEEKFSKSQQAIHARLILIRCYFDKFRIVDSYYDMLFFQIKAFEKYVRRKEVLPVKKLKEVLNFTKYLRKIIETVILKKDFSDLRIQIKATNNVSLKNWLLEKITSPDKK